ncbi:MAG: NAD-dependent epimerase/dehydratase family protein [Armatimonadetes bacterium]|nr:NAD-dependent epimerase/dehydratase family protein [Armatimonadota bacterium]
MSRFRKILVTGGTGVVGTAIKAIAREDPEREFVFFGSRESLRFFKAHKPDGILHFAAVSGGIQYTSKYPATMLRDNLLMNFNVLEAARLLGVGKTVMTLSAGMYPPDAPIPLREEYTHQGYPHDTNYSYSFAKRMIDPSIKAYRAEYGMSVIGLVSNGIFGENMNFKNEEAVMVGALIRRFHENRNSDERIAIWGDGSPLREYTYSQDLARAFMWCLDHYDDAQILNVGSTEEHEVGEIARMIADVLGIAKGRLFFDTSKPAGIYRRNTDNSKFVRLSGFRYTPFRDGLERTIRWFSENHDRSELIRL